jgi:hypothetical protein
VRSLPRHPRALLPLAVLALATGAACSHGPAKPKENAALFLTLNHVSFAGELSGRPDAELLALGHRACADLDAGLSTDAVVADLGGQPEPGSARFTAYAYVAATAAKELCPRHAGAFSGTDAIVGGSAGDGNG